MTDKPVSFSLHDKVLRAALNLTGGDIQQQFTAEQVLVQAWKEDNEAWGLRGYTTTHPDANRIYTKLDGESGLVNRGFLKNVGQRTYQLTESGLARAATIGEATGEIQVKLQRDIQAAVLRVLEHPVFRSWIESQGKSPAKFRDAGVFWGIAPGTPPKVVRARVMDVDNILNAAERALGAKAATAFVSEFGEKARMYGPEDIERCREFQAALKARFGRDLRILDPGGPYP